MRTSELKLLCIIQFHSRRANELDRLFDSVRFLTSGSVWSAQIFSTPLLIFPSEPTDGLLLNPVVGN